MRALIPVVRRQVTAGGMRLAKLLDDALGPEAYDTAYAEGARLSPQEAAALV